MGCSSCAMKKANRYQDFKSLEVPPFRATDIVVYNIEKSESRRFVEEDWNFKITNVLLFVPSVDVIKEIEEQHPKEGVQFTYVTNQALHQVKDFFENGGRKPFNNRIFISYLLPSRMNLLYNGFAKKAIAYIMSDGDLATQQLFFTSSFNYKHIYELLSEYEHDNN